MDDKQRLDREYKEWLEKQSFQNIDDEKLKMDLLDEMKYLSSMSVEEYTLYQKWMEINEKYSSVKPANPFFDTSAGSADTAVLFVKESIWMPKHATDYTDLEPTLIETDKNTVKDWNIIRTFVCSLVNNSNIGRNIRFLVVDKKTNKYLGVICVGSDFMDLTARDNYIGWSRDIKTKQKMINHTAIGSSIVPTQPLGFNYVGGKLLALLTLSRPIEDAWNKRYGDKLVGITTTSLYGSYSQYNRLNYWRKCGHSSGSVKYVPSKKMQARIREWLKLKHPREYWEWYHATRENGLPYKRDHKQRSLAFVYKEMKIPKEYVQADHKRGIYFAPLFKNTNDFLRKEIKEKDLVRKFDNSVEALVELWKEKYAAKRVKNLMKDNRLNTNGLFYDDMIGKTWEEVQAMYMDQIGR